MPNLPRVFQPASSFPYLQSPVKGGTQRPSVPRLVTLPALLHYRTFHYRNAASSSAAPGYYKEAEGPQDKTK